MKLQAGIRLLREIEGHGDPIQDCDRFDGFLKFYRNKGDPLEFDTVLQPNIPYVVELNGIPTIAWGEPKMHKSNVTIQHSTWLARQGDILPGIYYSILGMRTMGYRHVVVPPHLFAHSVHQLYGLDRESVVKIEIFLTAIHPKPAAPPSITK
jgi:hypothetical protein